MEGFTEFKDRGQLYQAVEKSLKLKKLEEDYSERYFGNYYVTFSAGQFLIQYNNDRSQLIIYLASNFAPTRWFPFVHIKNFILKKDKLANNEGFALKNILEQNVFLEGHFSEITELLNEENYKNTFDIINAKLRDELKS